MSRRLVAFILLVVITPQLAGCSSWRTVKVAPAQVEDPGEERIIGVTTAEGREVEFDPVAVDNASRAQLVNDTIRAAVDGSPYAIALEAVSHVWLRRQDKGGAVVRSILLGVGIAAVLFLGLLVVVAATKDSCPFIYSWDGETYVFDAEPYGGAITRGLERDDYGALEHLVAEDGEYRLQITNEVRETQYTNLMELWVVDHQPGLRVIPDEWGKLHTIAQPRTMTAARDASANDMTAWLSEKDRTIWEPTPTPNAMGELRDEIVMTFPRPTGAESVRLVANAATGLWGSYMISEMLELRGHEVDDWYALIDNSPAAVSELYLWTLREETYVLRLEVETAAGWEARGLLPGGGPFVAEDRVVPLDLRGVVGDELRVRIRPPRGYWALNWFAVDYGSDRAIDVDTVAVATATAHDGADVRPALLAADDSYYEMPNMGDHGLVTFPAPPERRGLARTIILHSRGYYKLHLNEMSSPQTATLQRLIAEPGYTATLAAERYADWLGRRAER